MQRLAKPERKRTKFNTKHIYTTWHMKLKNVWFKWEKKRSSLILVLKKTRTKFATKKTMTKRTRDERASEVKTGHFSIWMQ